MRTILFLFLIFVNNIGHSQNPNDETLIGFWSLISSRIVHPSICVPGRDPAANAGQQFVFYKLNDFIYCLGDKLKYDMIKGTWKIKDENVLIINFNKESLEYKIRFIDSRLFLRNGFSELEFERKN